MIEQSEPVGHAVRAVYMYSGMADVAAVTGDQAMRAAGKRIWDYLVTSKLYLTGGIGASGSGEAFGQPYELPNMTAYNETCASVGMDFWNHRLFLLEGDAKYIDVMERTLYNGLLSGVSLDGKTFFYPNPLESNGQHARQEWFGVACCPGNITRFMPSVPGYLYATKGDSVYVNLFAQGHGEDRSAGRRDHDRPGHALSVGRRRDDDGEAAAARDASRSTSAFPDGRATSRCRATSIASSTSAGAGRIGDASTASRVPMTLDKGYVTIDRTWAPGDTIALNLPMPVRRIVSNDQVIADRDRVALQRGPIVYAAEWPDNPNGKVRNIVLPDGNALTTEFRGDLLNGVQVIRGRATGLALDAKGGADPQADQPFMAIPYCDVGESRPRTDGGVAGARRCRRAADAVPDVVTTRRSPRRRCRTAAARIRATSSTARSRRTPSDSSAYFDWWPVQGSKVEWVEMTFAKPSTVSSSEIYWFDDTGRGGVRVPASWRLLYKSGNEWLPVRRPAPFGVARNAWNTVRVHAGDDDRAAHRARRCSRASRPACRSGKSTDRDSV